MGGKGRSVRRKHNIGVAVVGGNDNRTAKLLYLCGDFSKALVHRLAGGNSRRKNAGVPHHIRVGIV